MLDQMSATAPRMLLTECNYPSSEGVTAFSEASRSTTVTLRDNTGGSIDVHVTGEAPQWFVAMLEDIQKALVLRANWDGYGAIAVTKEAARSIIMLAANLMRPNTPRPSVVPTNRGGLQLEWHQGGVDLEIRSSMPGVYEAFYCDADGEWERTLFFNFTELTPKLAKLVH
ncbi:MAG: hypothetical protein IT381_19020 [Deltaproteobacteria bacterium]|nr:hypothetical protein [Deltaproteobacteria bacterium]